MSDPKTLAASTADDRITPPEQQLNPSAAQAVHPEGHNRDIDTVAATASIPPLRKPEAEPTNEPVDRPKASTSKSKS